MITPTPASDGAPVLTDDQHTLWCWLVGRVKLVSDTDPRIDSSALDSGRSLLNVGSAFHADGVFSELVYHMRAGEYLISLNGELLHAGLEVPATTPPVVAAAKFVQKYEARLMLAHTVARLRGEL